MFTIPNGQIVKTLNLSKDWARAVVDIPVPTSADLNAVNDVLHEVAEKAIEDPALKDLLLDAPAADGRGEHRAGHREPADGGAHAAGQAVRGGPPDPRARRPGAPPRRHRVVLDGHDADGRPRSRIRRRRRGPRKRRRAHRSRSSDLVVQGQARPRFRVSTVVLIVAFIALFWVQQTFQPEPAPRSARARGRPARFRARPELHLGAANERPAAEGADHHTTTTPTTTTTETTTPSPDDTTTSPTSPTPDDDGGRSGRSGWPAGAADADADTGRRQRRPRHRPYRERCPPRPRRRDSPTGPALSHRYTGVP